MSHCRRSITSGIALALLLGLGVASSAQQSALLSELYAGGGPNGNGSLIQDDKTFWFFGTVLGENLQDQFSATNFGTSADVPTPADIFVHTLASVGPIPGPGVAFTGRTWNVNANEAQDTAFHYVVTTGSQLWPSNGPNYITDASLDFGGAGVTGTGAIHLHELLQDESSTVQGAMLAEVPGIGHAEVVFPTTQNWFLVSKDLLLDSNGAGTASISDLDQHFSQVPEPGAYATMLGVVITGVLGFTRRRARR